MESLNDPCPSCGRRQDEALNDRSLHCNQCDYEWIRKSGALPKTCPMCRSIEWNLPKADRLMCQQCGHVWKSTSGHPKRCPKCRSKVWDQPLRVVRCQRCGHVWKMRATRSDQPVSACPGCGTRNWSTPVSFSQKYTGGRVRYSQSELSSKRLLICRACNNRWYSSGEEGFVCPGCGTKASFHDRIASTSMVLWTDGRSELTYVTVNGYGCVYLWNGDVPVACKYVHEVLAFLKTTIRDIAKSVNDGIGTYDWVGLADMMREGQSDCEKFIGYFEKRLSLSEFDARILAIHFTGMSPEAIAKKLSLDESEVFASFDRIMAAYSDSGIIVNDTIYTNDPFLYY